MSPPKKLPPLAVPLPVIKAEASIIPDKLPSRKLDHLSIRDIKDASNEIKANMKSDKHLKTTSHIQKIQDNSLSKTKIVNSDIQIRNPDEVNEAGSTKKSNNHKEDQEEITLVADNTDAEIEETAKPSNCRYDIKLTEILSTLPLIFEQKEPLTPLILDPTGRTDTFFTYSSGNFETVLLDVKKYLYETEVSKAMSKSECHEEIRRKIVNALKYGKLLHIAMQDSAFLFSKYYDSKFFPHQILKHCGKYIYNENIYTQLLRPSDYEPTGFFIPDPNFKVIVTSKFEEDEYKEFLLESINLEDFCTVIVK